MLLLKKFSKEYSLFLAIFTFFIIGYFEHTLTQSTVGNLVGFGILFAVIGFFYENFKKIISLIFMPLFFISALFYTIDSLPFVIKQLLLYNPVVHFMEMIHGNYFYALNTKYVDYNYMLIWTLVPLYLGLYLYIKSYRKIIMS